MQNVAETDPDEYRHVLDEQTNYEFRQCEEQAESAVRNLKTQLRQAGKNQEYEWSMKEQYLLREELQHRDKVHRGHLNHMREMMWKR